MAHTIILHDPHSPLLDALMASVLAEQTDLQSHLDKLEKAWPNADLSAMYGQTMLGIAGLPPAGYVDGMTPKVQPTEPTWNGGTVSGLPGHWQNPSCLQSEKDLSWPTNDKFDGSIEHAQQPSTEPEHFHPNVPMPVPTRSATEPLWQRRLNTKNRELEQLHHHPPSAPEVATAKISRHYSVGNPQQSDMSADDSMHHWSQPRTAGAMQSDYSNASPNTLRMLSIDTSDALSNHAPTVNTASLTHSAKTTAPNDSPHMNDMASFNGSNGFGNNEARPDFASQLSFMQSLSSNGMLSATNQGMHQTNMFSEGYSSSGFSPSTGLTSPMSFGQSYHHTDNQARHRQNDAEYALTSANIGDASHDVYPTSPSLAATNGKGIINKVMVPSANGAASDSIDLRTGEAGQMRHMCPHPGCDKHFSTSGHARRHSRIHDCLRPFECPHEGCHATFTRRDNCTQHQRARHKFQLVAHRMGDEDD